MSVKLKRHKLERLEIKKVNSTQISAIALILVMLLDLLAASMVSASQMTHYSTPIAQNNTAHMSESVPPCHESGSSDADEQQSGSAASSTLANDSGSNMSCCDDDCSHCPAFISYMKSSGIHFSVSDLDSPLENPSNVPLVSGYYFSVYRPPAII
ncbi:MAG: hypothetical protein ACRBCS_05245 [Cellvibrionaceae bacterium]